MSNVKPPSRRRGTNAEPSRGSFTVYTPSREINFPRLVAEAMWYWLWRLCGARCGGFVVLVSEAMCCLLRRLCGAGCGGYVLD
jgi:hypothetical protein